jgi:formylglycine-generating enzyme required for sulfatase activity
VKTSWLLFLLGAAEVVAIGCAGSGRPRDQVLVRIDTDAPVPAFVDRLRVEVFDGDGVQQDAPREFPLLNPSDWPLSLGIRAAGGEGRIRARLRLRAFRTGYEQPDEPSAPATIPGGVTIDRLVDVDFTPTRGEPVGYVSVTLQADCFGVAADVANGTTCIAAPVTDVGTSAPVAPEHVASAAFDAPTRAGTWPGAREVPCLAPAPPPAHPDEERSCVAGGAFLFGFRDAVPLPCPLCNETPERVAVVSPYYVDRFEVSVRRFRAAMRDPLRPFLPPVEPTLHNPEDTSLEGSRFRYCTWRGKDADDDALTDTLPVNCVPFETAQALCRWGGGDLPLEVQWEYVASKAFRTAKSIYPWGDESPSCESAVFNQYGGKCPRTTPNMFLPVTSPFPGGPRRPGCAGSACVRDETPGPGGRRVIGLAGNVEEWVRDLRVAWDAPCWRAAGRRDPACVAGADETKHMIRGGGVLGGGYTIKVGSRSGGYELIDVAVALGAVGFRCVYPATDDASKSPRP